MKRLFLSILIIFTALPFFAVGLQHEAYFGDSDGLNTALVFGTGKIKNSVGLYFESYQTYLHSNHQESQSHSSSYPLDPYRENEKVYNMNLGVFYQFTWSPTFKKIGNIGIGMDLPLQIGFCYDAVCGANLSASLVPAFKIEFSKCDLLIGYRAELLLREATDDLPFLKSACTIGIRYNIKGKTKASTKSSGKKSSSKFTSKQVTEDSDYQEVNIIPGSDIKTIYN